MIVAILISVHLLADFLFQSSAVIERKRQERKFLFLHCFIYFIVFEILFFTLFQCKKVFLLGLIISILHFLINFIKNKLEKKFPQRRLQLLFFLLSQLVHIVMIVGVYYIFNLENLTNNFYIKLQGYENFKTIIFYILIFSIILDPASVFIRKLFISISPARFKQMENRDFAEKYLIGTLTSFLIVLLSILTLKGLL